MIYIFRIKLLNIKPLHTTFLYLYAYLYELKSLAVDMLLRLGINAR